MRLLIPLLFTLPLTGETCEAFTLADGRHLIGTYDSERQHLRLAGPIAAGIRVPPAAIVERRPATDDEIPAAAAPADPGRARASRIAWLRTAIRGLDNAMGERAHHRTAIGSRLTTSRDNLAQLHHDIQIANNGLIALIQERQRVQGLVDEIEQARALTELRVVAITSRHERSEDARTSSLTISELTTELTAATGRIADLRCQLAAIDGALAARRSAIADLQDDANRLARTITEDENRLARYTAADAEASAEAQRLRGVLDGVLADDPSAPSGAQR